MSSALRLVFRCQRVVRCSQRAQLPPHVRELLSGGDEGALALLSLLLLVRHVSAQLVHLGLEAVLLVARGAHVLDGALERGHDAPPLLPLVLQHR